MTKPRMILLGSLIWLLAPVGQAADIAGQWRGEFDSQIGMQKYVFTFQTQSNKLTGKADSEVNGQKRQAELKEGVIDGETVSFVEMLSFQGNEIRIRYTGKLGKDAIAFTREVGDFAKEDFKAKRVEAGATSS